MRRALKLEDYPASVVAVPPLALNADLMIAEAANRALVKHIEAGGIRILLYGGNANLYHIDLGRFQRLLEVIGDVVAPETALVASIGPNFGKMLDEAALLRSSGIANVMLLPMAFPSDPAGVERGVRAVADKLGFPVILYVKREGYLAPAQIESLVADGAVQIVKYAVECADPFVDPYLDSIIAAIGTERLSSGMGEIPLTAHLQKYGLATFTSGAACIAPAATLALLRAHKAKDAARVAQLAPPFIEFETLRARLGGIAVLHDAVSLSGIADMGPILPLLSGVAPSERKAVEAVTAGLVAAEAACRSEVR